MPHHIPHRFPQREIGSQIIFSNPGIFGRNLRQVSIWDERNPNTTAALAMMSPNSSTFLALRCATRLFCCGAREPGAQQEVQKNT